MREIVGLKRPFAVQTNSKGDIYVADFNASKVLVYNSDLDFVKELWAPFSGPHCISFDKNENIYITDYYAKKVFKFDPNGENCQVLLEHGKMNPKWLCTGPAMAHLDPNQNLIVSGYGTSSLQKYTTEGEFLGWLGIDTNGNFSRWGLDNQPMTSKKEGGFDRVHSVGFDTKKNMIVVDTWNNRLQKFDHEGNFIQFMPGTFSIPVSIDFCGDTFVVSENGTHSVQCFKEDGTFLWKKFGYSWPYDVKLKGNILMVADANNHRIVFEEV